MRRLTFSFLLALLSVHPSLAFPAEVPAAELPMYGGIQKDDSMKKKDAQFIEEAIQQYGSKEKAAEAAIQLAWDYFNQGDFKLAMRRFNHAWLLDPEHAEVSHGFGVLLATANKTDEAIAMLEKAVAKNSKNPKLLFDLGLTFGQKADSLSDQPQAQDKIWDRAVQLFERTVEADPRFFMAYEMLAKIHYNRAHYPAAWKVVRRAQSAGGSFKPDFLHQLAAQMPDPEKPRA